MVDLAFIVVVAFIGIAGILGTCYFCAKYMQIARLFDEMQESFDRLLYRYKAQKKLRVGIPNGAFRAPAGYSYPITKPVLPSATNARKSS